GHSSGHRDAETVCVPPGIPPFSPVALFFFKQKTAYEITVWLEFRRVLFRSRPDLKAEGHLDNLVATGIVQSDENRSTGFRVLRTKNRLPRLAASARPADWSILSALLIERDFLNAVPSAGPKLADILRSLHLSCLTADSVARSGYACWPYQAPTPYFAIPSGLPDGRPWPRISIVTPS